MSDRNCLACGGDIPSTRRSDATFCCQPCKTRHWKRVNVANQMLLRARERSARNGRECTITEADIIVPDVCPVLGIPLLKGTRKAGRNSPTLDRIDNRLGYVPGNVRVISLSANSLKGWHIDNACNRHAA